MAGFAQKELFGGALTCFLPLNVLDASDVRQVPDNQEIFLNSSVDQNIIFDILETPDENVMGHAATFHYREIIDDHSSDEASLRILSTDSILLDSSQFCPNCPMTVSSVVGLSSADSVMILSLVVFRLPQFRTDIVVSFNDSSSNSESPQKWSLETFQAVLRFFRLKDTSLFIN